jgi:adenine deaminase
MRVDISFYDHEALTSDEIKERLKSLGLYESIRISPDSNDPEDFIFLGISELISKEQIDILLDEDPEIYKEKVKRLKDKVIKKITIILDRVVLYNEKRIADG